MKSSKLAVVSGKSTPVDIIVGNDDLLTEILKRVPVIPLLRFESVCRKWLSLITDPLFTPRPNPNLTLPSGLFLPSLSSILEYDFIPLDAENPIKSPFRTLDFVPGITILSSSNGLLCCGNTLTPLKASGIYVFNPCNHKFVNVPPPDVRASTKIVSVHIAFDPLKSPFYKLILVVYASHPPNPERVLIGVYSSETGKWMFTGKIFNVSVTTHFTSGVYFRGAIHWYTQTSSTCYFDLDQEQIYQVSIPPIVFEHQFRYCMYFGECSGHLHLIESSGPTKPKFDIYEMEKDRSKWFLKYRVDLNAMVNMYGDVILYMDDSVGQVYGCLPLYVFETESNEDSHLLLHVPGKIMKYNLLDNTFKIHSDFDPSSNNGNYFLRAPPSAIPFIASLSCV